MTRHVEDPAPLKLRATLMSARHIDLCQAPWKKNAPSIKLFTIAQSGWPVCWSTAVKSTIDPSDDDGQDNQPINPFDPQRLRISGVSSEGPTARKILTSVQVRKPTGQEWLRVHADPQMRLDTLLLEMRDKQQTYLVAPDIAPGIPSEVAAKTLYSTITQLGAVLLWLVLLPDEHGRLDE